MEILFLVILLVVMAGALASGYPVAFALPGAAILTILLAAVCGHLFAGDAAAYFAHGSAPEWLSLGSSSRSWAKATTICAESSSSSDAPCSCRRIDVAPAR